MFESLLPQLAELQCPTLLIKAKYNWMAADDQVAAFQRSVCDKEKIAGFGRSGHFARVEEPARYAKWFSALSQKGRQ